MMAEILDTITDKLIDQVMVEIAYERAGQNYIPIDKVMEDFNVDMKLVYKLAGGMQLE